MDDLLIKYLLGEATPEERARVERWLGDDAGHRKRFLQFRSVWEISRQTAAAERAAPGIPPPWRQPAPKPAANGSPRTIDMRERTRPAERFRLAAVTIGMLLLGAGGYWTWMARRPTARIPVITMRAPNSRPAAEGKRLLAGRRPMTTTLPDGTVLTLNRGASATIAREAGPNGTAVRLMGEGFFAVPPHASRPFVVQAGPLTIKVLGTSFEVNQQGDSVELVVESGAVEVKDSMIVRAGEELAVTGRGRWVRTLKRDDLYGYYLGRPLVCDSTPLRRLVEVLNRCDDTPIVLARKDLGDLPLTTEFREVSPERIARILALTFDLSVVRRGPAIILQ